jgi:hypothetical protein
VGNVILKPTKLSSPRHSYSIKSPQVEPPRRKKKRSKLLQGFVITVGAMLMTVLVIRASDSWAPPARDLLSGAGASTKEARCPADMIYVSDSGGGFCIDRYEASAGKLCPRADPTNQFDTNENLSVPVCTSVSVKDADPWVNIPLSQAMELCARVGKHLPKNSEWYRAALGTSDDVSDKGCVLGRIGANHAEKTGVHDSCISSAGAYDMVGNVWEWVDANVVGGELAGRALPEEGYVSEADVDGIAVKTSTTSSPVFHNDYFYMKRDGVNGMIRGGFWNLTDKAGVSSINATIPTSFIGNAVGFRCAR